MAVRGLVFLLASLAGWLSALPASWVVRHVPLPESLRVRQVEGPWWQGHANLRWRNEVVGQVSWQLRGVSWLWGRPSVAFNWRQGDRNRMAAHAVLSAWSGEIRLKDVSGDLALVPLLRWAGQPPLAEGRLRIDHLDVTLHARPHWWPTETVAKGVLINGNVAGLRLPDTLNWQLDQSGADQLLALKAQGQVSRGRLSLSAHLARDGAWQAQVSLHDAPNPPGAWRTLLRSQGEGRWSGTFSGRVTLP